MVESRAVAAPACSTPVWTSCGVSAVAVASSRRASCLGVSCVVSFMGVWHLRLVFSSRAVVSSVRLVLFFLVAVRFAAARRCLLVMPSRRSVVRIVICLISRLIVIGQGGAVRVFLRRLVDTPVVSWSVAFVLWRRTGDTVLHLRSSGYSVLSSVCVSLVVSSCRWAGRECGSCLRGVAVFIRLGGGGCD